MKEFAIAFALMVLSAFISIYIGERVGVGKTQVYVLGLVTLLAQIVVLFSIRGIAN